MKASLAQLLTCIPGARLVPGALLGAASDTAFDGVSTDSRSVAPGALFVALRGEHFDAHDFLPQVAARGAACVLAEALPPGWTLPALLVPDTLAALGHIAHFWRRQHVLPLLGVTGSNGKTTVKEMIAAILAAAYGASARLATRGNFNNEIGVPLTVLRLQAGHRAAVIELGMNHPGEIARLCAIAAPTLGLVNNAQREHQEFMHSVAAVALENGAVLAALPADGIGVFPHDDEFTPLWRELSGARRVITFGLEPQADISCTYRVDAFGSQLQVSVRSGAGAQQLAPAQQFGVVLAAAGVHNVRNALAAIACALGAGIDTQAIVRGLQAFAPAPGRLQQKRAADGVHLIDDTYNANPDSVRAAIDVLAMAPAPRFLVLGDMGEVGGQGRQFHEEIAAYAASQGIDHVLATGVLARHLKHAGPAVEHFEEFDALLAALDAHLARCTGNELDNAVADPAATAPSCATVLVKGSRFMKMERVVQHLTTPNNNNKETA